MATPTRARPRPRISPRRWTGSARDPTTRPSSIIWDPAVDVGFKGRLWRLSLDLRRLQLDGEVRRSRIPHPRHGRPALHPDRDAGGGGRCRAAPIRPLRPGIARARRRAAPIAGPARAARANRPRRSRGSSSKECPSWSAPSARFRRRPRSSIERPMLSHGTTRSHPTDSPRSTMRSSKVERAFLLDEGLPGRPWFKHAVYAPGLTTGYAAGPCRRSARRSKTRTRRSSPPAIAKTVERIKKAAEALNVARDQAAATGR